MHWLLEVGSAPGVPGSGALRHTTLGRIPLARHLRRLVVGDVSPGMARITRLEGFAQVLYASRPTGYAITLPSFRQSEPARRHRAAIRAG